MNAERIKKIFFYFSLTMIILFGILLRLKGFLINPSFWHDECAMAWNIKFKSYFELFGILRFLQVAPPFFSMSVKFLTQIFGYSEMVFRLIPFVTGCLSVIAFYFLSKKSFKSNFSILVAVFLFAINQRLINFSFEFKPYGVDVFFTIICLLFFVNLDLKKLNKKTAVVYGLLLSIVPWFSFVSVFALAGGFLNLFFQIKIQPQKEKNDTDVVNRLSFVVYCILLAPLVISGLIYLKAYLLTNYTGTSMVNDWQAYFVTANPLKFLFLLAESFKYLFFPVSAVLFCLLFFFGGIFIYLKEKSSVFNIVSLSFILFLVSSFFHIYPFGNRIILFLIPVYLLFMLKPLDFVSFDNKIKSFIIVLVAMFTFYPQVAWLGLYIDKNLCKGENPREMMEVLSENIKNGDIVFVSNLSNTEFAYYSTGYNFKNLVIQEPQKSNRNHLLNSIEKGRYCWFYLTFGKSDSYIDWINKNTKMIKMFHYKGLNDYLIYVYIK